MKQFDSHSTEPGHLSAQANHGQDCAPATDALPRTDTRPRPRLETALGRLYQGDCIELMQSMEADSVDVVFADPPFNLAKNYPSKMNDRLREADYLCWSEAWLTETARLLKPGGSLFVWNLPKWNLHAAAVLRRSLTFRHWIAVDIKYSLPIAKRLYPSHYSLLYFCKGDKPRTFAPDRLPMPICPACHTDLKDYGGYKDRMNPRGVNLPDVWTDIPPVRHAKYKGRKGANELSLKLLDRVVQMASVEGDVILDPFGGAGTTYVACELKRRRWIGIELGPTDDIVERFTRLDAERHYLEKIRSGYNNLFTPAVAFERRRKGLWTSETFRDALNTNGEERQPELEFKTDN